MGVESGHCRRAGRGGAEADEAVRPDEDGAAAGRASLGRVEIEASVAPVIADVVRILLGAS